MKKIIILGFIGATAFIAGCFFSQAYRAFVYRDMPSIVSAANDVYRPAELKSSMIWVSTVSSIAEYLLRLISSSVLW